MSREDSVREWVGGRFALPARIECLGERRAEISLWVELPELQVVGQVLEDPADPEATFAQSLMRAMASPLVGAPRRPQRVRVGDPALAEELRCFSFLRVEVAPTPELDKVRRSLGAFFGEASYFSDPALSPSDLRAFFAAACALWAVRPWTMVDDDALVQVEVPSQGIRSGCVSIVGALGVARGFVFFPSPSDYERMLQRGGRSEAGSGQGALCFSYDPRGEVPEAMRREVAEHHWPLPEADVYPTLLRAIDGRPAPVFASEVRLMTELSSALAAFVAQHAAALSSYGEAAVRMSQRGDSDLELILSVPYARAGSGAAFGSGAPKMSRADPCPCGSGERYGYCCAKAD